MAAARKVSAAASTDSVLVFLNDEPTLQRWLFFLFHWLDEKNYDGALGVRLKRCCALWSKVPTTSRVASKTAVASKVPFCSRSCVIIEATTPLPKSACQSVASSWSQSTGSPCLMPRRPSKFVKKPMMKKFRNKKINRKENKKIFNCKKERRERKERSSFFFVFSAFFAVNFLLLIF